MTTIPETPLQKTDSGAPVAGPVGSGSAGADPARAVSIPSVGRSLPGPLRFLARSFGTLWSNGKARTGLILLGLMIAVAILAPLLAPYSPTRTDFEPYLNPSSLHWIGTTGNGEDGLSQLIYGTRVSLFVGFAAGITATLVAALVGLIAGYLPGVVDEILSFVTNLALVIPGIPLMIILAAYLPTRGVPVITLVVVVTGWATGARVIRSQTSTLRSRDFVTAAEFAGDRLLRLVFREILPNMTSVVAASFFGAAVAAVLGEASLEFLGLGDPATVSWGTMLYWAQNNKALLVGQWALILAPGLAIALLMVAFALINFGVDALSNPRLREKS